MKTIPAMMAALLGLSSMGSVHAAPLVSHFPKQNLGQFLTEKFDLASIRSSFGPRRTAAQRTFADFGMKPTTATNDALVFHTPGQWRYEMKILGRRDMNGDGIEDLAVCFTDRALNGGSYDTSTGLVITRYSAEGYALALSYSLGDERCPEHAR